MKNITITEDAIYIYDRKGSEIVSWVESEWIEDASIVPGILSAAIIFLTQGEDALKDMLVSVVPPGYPVSYQ